MKNFKTEAAWLLEQCAQNSAKYSFYPSIVWNLITYTVMCTVGVNGLEVGYDGLMVQTLMV